MKEVKFEWTEQQKKDFLATYEFWCWSAETGGSKEDWPEYRKVNHINRQCAFCRYFDHQTCPLNIRRCSEIGCCDGLYDEWEYFIKEDTAKAKYYAKLIRNRIRKYLEKQGIFKVDKKP